ncbi:hypothetical protein [Algoriphagus sp. CAU 1675]|uniref:hypothetical protein n=1 Tax=Algoriphagus sp. CAU 1675 TaxID=3032597 RepID=UPI0023DCDAD9|nr:hypothetical protein [Algoriphagus sp. CAU 1675]MDF2157421.1 hypothetical protein [Algoriphagus sp. CAU 1675]
MERLASFFLILMIYFLGTLAIVQQVIRPKRLLISDQGGKSKHWVTNYFKIILLSFLLALLTTILAYYLFI